MTSHRGDHQFETGQQELGKEDPNGKKGRVGGGGNYEGEGKQAQPIGEGGGGVRDPP